MKVQSDRIIVDVPGSLKLSMHADDLQQLAADFEDDNVPMILLGGYVDTSIGTLFVVGDIIVKGSCINVACKIEGLDLLQQRGWQNVIPKLEAGLDLKDPAATVNQYCLEHVA